MSLQVWCTFRSRFWKDQEVVVGVSIIPNCYRYFLFPILWKWRSLSHVQFFATPWTIQSMEFSRPEYWSGLTFPFSRGFFLPRDWIQVSCIAGRFSTSWATREAQEYWSGWPIPSPASLPNPGVELGSPALRAGFSPTELWGKPGPNPTGKHKTTEVTYMAKNPQQNFKEHNCKLHSQTMELRTTYLERPSGGWRKKQKFNMKWKFPVRF